MKLRISNDLSLPIDAVTQTFAILAKRGAGRILRVLADAHPKAMTKEELGEAAQMSSNSGSFSTYLSRLRTLELIEGSNPIKASDEFFS